MNAATVRRDAITTAIRKTMPPADNPSARELRQRRDMVWMLLSRTGLSGEEIARACLFASRSRRQINRRLKQLARHHERRGQPDGGLYREHG